LSDDTNRRYADLLVNPLAFLSEGYGEISYGVEKAGSLEQQSGE
jgi:hypothetical protein